MPVACTHLAIVRGAGAYQSVECAPMSEQINSRLRKQESSMSYMRQTTFLRHLRIFLYLLNERNEEA